MALADSCASCREGLGCGHLTRVGVGEGIWKRRGGCDAVQRFILTYLQYGGSPVKVGDEEYSLFRDHE